MHLKVEDGTSWMVSRYGITPVQHDNLVAALDTLFRPPSAVPLGVHSVIVVDAQRRDLGAISVRRTGDADDANLWADRIAEKLADAPRR